MRSIRLLSKSQAARDFSFYSIIRLKDFSAEWLAPPQKVHLILTRFVLSLFLPQPELLSIFRYSFYKDEIDKDF